MRRALPRLLLGLPALAMLTLFFVLPYVEMVAMSFRAPAAGQPFGAGYTVTHYTRALGDPIYFGALIRSLIPGGSTLLRPETLALMMQSHLPQGVFTGFPKPVTGKSYGLGGAVSLSVSSIDPPDSVGEFQWGGMAGTHWWINPRRGLAGVVMAQRDTAFWHPFSFAMKQAVYQAAA
jgi:CubicO group peptidase (beta-lactamase class C family)